MSSDDALGAVDIAALGIVPLRLVLGDEVVELDDAAGLGEVAEAVPFDRIDVERPTLGGDVLHHLGEFLAVRDADDIDLDAGLFLPKLLDRRGAIRERAS